MRRLLPLLVAVTALASASCSLDEALPHPDCVRGGSVPIVAQSVPEAELVPCLGPLPDGWSVATVHIDQRGSDVELDSDRAGTARAGSTTGPAASSAMPSPCRPTRPGP